MTDGCFDPWYVLLSLKLFSVVEQCYDASWDDRKHTAVLRLWFSDWYYTQLRLALYNRVLQGHTEERLQALLRCSMCPLSAVCKPYFIDVWWGWKDSVVPKFHKPLCLQLASLPKVTLLSDVCQLANILYTKKKSKEDLSLTFFYFYKTRQDRKSSDIFWKKKKKFYSFNKQTSCRLIKSMSCYQYVQSETFINRDAFLQNQKAMIWNPVQISGGCCGDLGYWSHLSVQLWVYSIASTYLQVKASIASLTDSSQILFVQKGDTLYKIKSLLFFHVLHYLIHLKSFL